VLLTHMRRWAEVILPTRGMGQEVVLLLLSSKQDWAIPSFFSFSLAFRAFFDKIERSS
jgi:hypothetical protein